MLLLFSSPIAIRREIFTYVALLCCIIEFFAYCYFSGVPEEIGSGLSLVSSATDGALLILPEGAKRSDHQQYTRFAEHAAKHAHSWYKYVNGPSLARGVPNGALYLINGYDKARAWGVASFKNAPGKINLEFVPKLTGTNEEGLPEYRFRKYDFVSHDADSDQNQSGSVFLRGFKIALQQTRNPFVPTCAKVEKILKLDAEELLPTRIISPNNPRRSELQQLWHPAPSRFPNRANHQHHTYHGSDFDFPERHQAGLYLVY